MARRRDSASAASHAAVLIGYFGAHYDVRRLTVNDTTRYATARRAGGIPYTAADGTEKVTGPVRQRSVHAGLSMLRTLLLWACTVRMANGDRWLERNPLDGVRFEREKNPKRSTATWDQYEATRKALEKLAAEAGTEAERLKWVRLQFALWLAEALGRRRGSIVGLHWGDFDARRREVYWARYAADGSRRDGPAVDRPDAVPKLPVIGPAGDIYPGQLVVAPGPSRLDPGVMAVRGPYLPDAGREPLYLRRPDASEPSRPKSVLRAG